MRPTSLRLLGCVTSIILCLSTDAATLKRAQITFPPSNGPCRQNHGLEPLQCTDEACIDIAASGVCHIQTQEGLPVCGCCDSQITLLCSACGGDAGEGICLGTGLTEISFQGCPCTANGGAVPGGGQIAVCPEQTGSDTQSCNSSTCGGSTRYAGLCDSKTDIGGGAYQFCACCPDEEPACNDCGGDNGDGRCKGVDEYTGKGYNNCKCSSGAGSVSAHSELRSKLTSSCSGDQPVIIPFPIPPPGFPIPPPGTPNPEEPCSDTIDTKCSECDGNNKWCQTGPSAGCPCQDDEQECPDGDDVPNCSDANCGGATSASVISTCQGANNENKDCTCFQFEPELEPYAPFSDQQLLEQEAFLNSIFAAPATPTSSASPTQGSGQLTCSKNSASQVPKEMIWSDGSKTPNQVLYTLREVICTNSCEMPAGLPAGVAWKTGSKTTGDCEIAIAIEGDIEAVSESYASGRK
jgi:hypothetical protein